MKRKRKRSRLLLQLGFTFLAILVVLLTIVSLGIYETAVTDAYRFSEVDPGAVNAYECEYMSQYYWADFMPY